MISREDMLSLIPHNEKIARIRFVRSALVDPWEQGADVVGLGGYYDDYQMRRDAAIRRAIDLEANRAYLAALMADDAGLDRRVDPVRQLRQAPIGSDPVRELRRESIDSDPVRSYNRPVPPRRGVLARTFIPPEDPEGRRRWMLRQAMMS